MIPHPLGLRLNPSPGHPPREQLREAARLGAKGVVLDAAGDFAPDALSGSGRRDLRALLRAAELTLIAVHLPTRRPFDTEADLDDRLARADRAFAMAYELGTRLILARVGSVPTSEEKVQGAALRGALTRLGRQADHQGVRLAIEVGGEPAAGFRALLDELDLPGLAASLDPGAQLSRGFRPSAAALALGPTLAHAYATDPSSTGRRDAPALDWAEYLAALEQADYRGFLTVWPDPAGSVEGQFRAAADRVKMF